MSSIGYLEGLRAQKAELEADLASVERLIARAVIDGNGHTPVKKAPVRHIRRSTRRPRRPPGRKHVFSPDPNSVASRALSESRRVLDGTVSKTLPFATLIERLPDDLVATSKQRQYVRITLQRAGKRVGIDYHDADNVRLT